MSTEIIKKYPNLFVPAIAITASLWLIIALEIVFGLGPLYPSWIPRWVLVGFISICVGSVWVMVHKLALIPKYEV